MNSHPKIAHYRVLAKIGEGGMGEVWRATDTKLNREVAIKILPESFTQDAGRLARFTREAQVLASLNHPNIASIYGVEERALIMELVPGFTIADRIARGPIPAEEALPIAGQMAEALEYAHSHGVIHRDLKPANIIVTPEGRVKVLDFGLASREAAGESDRTITAATEYGAVLGTAGYMAPEQAASKTADARSDIFSFGVVLYEMLSGQRAFAEPTSVTTLAAILHKEPRPLRELAPEVPPEVEAIVTRCIAKAASDRFPGMGALRQALLEALLREPRQGSAPTQIASIGVLPFTNLSPDKENEYFSEGLAEELLNALGQVSGLRVIARSSAFACKGCTIREAGDRLKVTTVLLGSVRRAGNRIRVSVQLINVADESQIWSERYDRQIADVFAVQDEISRSIVEALWPRLSPPVRPAPSHTTALDAYHLLLKGRYFFNKLGPENTEAGRLFFEQAAAADPDYAAAKFELAYAQFAFAILGKTPPRQTVPSALQQLDRAIFLDPNLAEARSLRGLLWGLYEHRWMDGLRECEKAFTLNPMSALTPQWHAHILNALGRHAAAVEQQERTVLVDPFASLAHNMMAWVSIFARDFDRALVHARQATDISCTSPTVSLLAYVHGLLGNRAAALEALQKAPAKDPPGGLFAGLRGCAYILAGEPERAWNLLWEARDRAFQDYVASIGPAMICAQLGDSDGAFEHLESAYTERELALFCLPADPAFDKLRGDPRYGDLLRRMNLPHSGAPI